MSNTDQYLPNPVLNIADMEKFFTVDDSMTTASIFSDLDFTLTDVEYACTELSQTYEPAPDGIPASHLKECRRKLKGPLYSNWKASMDQGVIPPTFCLFSSAQCTRVEVWQTQPSIDL